MERIEAGMFARSLAGHDKDKLYLIYQTEGEYVWLTDGRLRPLAKPKKKKCRHIQMIHRMPENWNPEKISDDDVRRAIRQYSSESASHKFIKMED